MIDNEDESVGVYIYISSMILNLHPCRYRRKLKAATAMAYGKDR